MRSLTSTLHTATNRVAVIIGRTILLALATLAGLVLLGLMSGTVTGISTDAPVPTPPTSAPTPDTSGMAPHERPTTGGDGYADHHLFSDSAVLDTSHIDDLRDDPAGTCIAVGKVYTAGGSCLVAVYVLPDEVPVQVWAALRAQGYTYSIDEGDELCDAIWVPEGAMVAADGGRWLFTDGGPVLQPYAGR